MRLQTSQNVHTQYGKRKHLFIQSLNGTMTYNSELAAEVLIDRPPDAGAEVLAVNILGWTRDSTKELSGLASFFEERQATKLIFFVH